jgi:hypothetical protein
VAIWYILGLFGIFFPFWNVVARKIWQPWSHWHRSSLEINRQSKKERANEKKNEKRERES